MKTTCSRCNEPGFRFRGDRWLCVIHNRVDTMSNCARMKGKVIPTTEEFASLIADVKARGMKCESCDVLMQWFGKRGSLTTVSLQHDRSGRFRFICMLCNQRHDDLPGDSFYDLPPNSWRCSVCKRVLLLTAFYPKRAGGCCRECRKVVNKAKWAKFGKVWAANSKRRKSCES